MKRMIVVFSLVLCAACMSSTMTPSADVETALQAKVQEFEAALRARDLERVMALYADDAVFMPPNSPALSGSAAIRQFWTGLLAAPNVEADLIIEDIETCGDLAIERGRLEITAPFRDSGKYLVVWRNRGGRWQIVSDIFNSSLAPPR